MNLNIVAAKSPDYHSNTTIDQEFENLQARIKALKDTLYLMKIQAKIRKKKC